MTDKPFDFEKIKLTVQRISQTRFVLAISLIVTGIVFILNPEQSVENMGRDLAFCMVFAAGAMIIAKIAAKERFVRFLPALILLAAGGLMCFYPDNLSAYFRLLLALLIIINGAINLLDILGLTQPRKIIAALRVKVEAFFTRLKKPKELVEGMEEEAGKFMNPLYKIVSESKWHKVVYFTTNFLAVILGVLLLFQPDLSITIFGLIIIYTGISDLVMAFKTRKMSKDLRNKEHRKTMPEEPDEREKKAEG